MFTYTGIHSKCECVCVYDYDYVSKASGRSGGTHVHWRLVEFCGSGTMSPAQTLLFYDFTKKEFIYH